jgi:hypothetical protein
MPCSTSGVLTCIFRDGTILPFLPYISAASLVTKLSPELHTDKWVHVCCLLAYGALSIYSYMALQSRLGPVSLRRRLPPFLTVYCSSLPSFIPRICDVSFRTTSSQLVIGFLRRRVISYTSSDCWCNLLRPSSAYLCKPTETYCVVQKE